MASFNSYTGNGVTQNHAITFPYLHTTHVHAYLAGVETAAWTWFDSSTIQFTVAPGNGVAILIQRETPTSERLAEFTNGEALLDEELNTAALQALYVAEEAKDRANQSIAVNALNRYDFGGRRATNAADPVDAQDLVTKTWVETSGTAVLAQTITAKNAALAAETGAGAARDVAVTAAASADADATATAADRVVVAADKATVATDKATVAADKATVAADKAIVAADKATVNTDKGIVATDKGIVAADKGIVAADKATVATDKATTQGYRNEAETFRNEAQAAVGGVKVTNADTTAGKLNDKVAVTYPLIKSTGTPGGNETLNLQVDFPDLSTVLVMIAALYGDRMNIVGGVVDPLTDTGDVDTGAATNLSTATAGLLKPTRTTPALIATAGKALIGNMVDEGGLAAAFDGVSVQATPSTACKAAPSNSGYNNTAGVDWGAGVTHVLKRARMWPPSNAAFLGAGATGIKLQGSNDASAWTDLWSYSAGAAAGAEVDTNIHGTWTDQVSAFRYHQFNISGDNTTGARVAEVEPWEHIPDNLTVASNTFTASAVPTEALGFLTAKANTGTLTINTDLMLDVSRDGGTSWTTLVLAAVVVMTDGYTLYQSPLTSLATQPSGVGMRWRIRTTNNKDIFASAVGIQWR